ncbi:MAG: beta-lactamase family protein [Taibaiella sp.]|nr:beta-lactamase family protein [Taibaiella sp.]
MEIQPSQLASTSKPFTAVAILWLGQNGYLNIDAPVKSILPAFPYDEITIRMLLCHRSGLQDLYQDGIELLEKKMTWSCYNEDLLQLLHKHKPRLRFTPNTRFEYSNTNYALLARVVEEVSPNAIS